MLGWYYGNTAQSVFSVAVGLHERNEEEEARKMQEDALRTTVKVFGRIHK